MKRQRGRERTGPVWLNSRRHAPRQKIGSLFRLIKLSQTQTAARRKLPSTLDHLTLLTVVLTARWTLPLRTDQTSNTLCAKFALPCQCLIWNTSSRRVWCVIPGVRPTRHRAVEVLLYVHRNRRFIRDGSPGRPPRLSHSF